MSRIQVDANACIRCGACVAVCVIAKVYELAESTAVAARSSACWECGQCVAVCPTDAIDHEAFPLEECVLTESVDAPSLDQLSAAFRARRSCRTFRPQPVPRELVREAVLQSRWAPTAENRQAVDWIAFDDRARIADLSRATLAQMKRWSRVATSRAMGPLLTFALGRRKAQHARRAAPALLALLRRAAEGEDPIFYSAPVVLIGHGPADSPLARDDAIYATYNLMLAADRLGLATCQIGMFQLVVEQSASVRDLLVLPQGRRPQVAVCLGYPRHPYRRLVLRRTPDIVWNPR